MPTEDYYSGLALSEVVRKLADHHYASHTRHLSLYEYQTLQTLADRIDLPLRRQSLTPAEIDASWQQLKQVYWTVIAGEEDQAGRELYSVPVRVLPEIALLNDAFQSVTSSGRSMSLARRVPS